MAGRARCWALLAPVLATLMAGCDLLEQPYSYPRAHSVKAALAAAAPCPQGPEAAMPTDATHAWVRRDGTVVAPAASEVPTPGNRAGSDPGTFIPPSAGGRS